MTGPDPDAQAGDVLARARAVHPALPDRAPDEESRERMAELLEHWRGRLPAGELACLEVVVAGYPDAVDRETITAATNYQRSSRDTYLQRLRSRQLITDAGRGLVRASETLFGGTEG